MNNQLDSPCPGSRSSFGNEQFTLAGAWNDDDTLHNLEYTAAIDFPPEPRASSLTKAKPRRASKAPSFTIHEDNRPNSTTATARQSSLKRKTQDRGLSILAQPAQRFQRPRVSFAEVQSNASSRPRKVIDNTAKQPENNTEPKSRSSQKPSENNGLKKDVRRRTVYIPTEDTTVPTVFMSLFSPLKLMDAHTSSNINTASADETVPIYSLEERIAAKKKSRMPPAGKPQRAPLQQTQKATQQSAIVRDVVGRNGGKENVPPGYLIEGKESSREKRPPPELEVLSKEPLKKTQQAIHSTKTKVVQARGNEKPACKLIGEKSSEMLMTRTGIKDINGSLSKKQEVKRSIAKNRADLSSRPSKESILTEKCSAAPTHLSVPKVRPVNIDQQYPRFNNDISNTVMYEDDWLSHQEIVITQLVNGLFDSVGGEQHGQDPEVLRHELLHIYQNNAFLLLYKRLQASILYGALAPPKDVLRRGSRLPDDLGLKKSFLNLWLDTYDLHALRGAAETVVGRKMTLQPIRTSVGSSDSSAKQQKVLKRAVEAFLDTFVIRNMDKEENGDMRNDVAGGPYRRTLLRSIMIIALLDKARRIPGNSLPRCLFNSSSPHKSSSAALQALANLLLPSMGDINRQVSHLDFDLSYKQHQLQDYDFRIHNLAVDLRDGVILTRIVEILLYPSASSFHARRESIGVTDETSLSGDEATEYPLSQKLKFPCVSRACKIFNVQIALGALKKVTGINQVAKELCADHIVDGYREKTIALLWLLAGKWGLSEIVDWDDARNEIVRLQKKLALDQGGQDSKVQKLKDTIVYESHEDLLVRWASVIAQLKGLQLVNLTTSFADGKIFESIVSEYEAFLLGRDSSTELHATDKGSLQSRLQALGCSSQFASLVAGSTSSSRIFDRDFVLGALTFLCSRLLSSSKCIRAAITIQQAWRRISSQENLRRRMIKKDIAEQCLEAPPTRPSFEMMASSTAIIELELQPVQERSKANEQKSYQSVSGSTLAKEGQVPDLETSSSGQQPAVVVHALERWNDPAVNIYRLFATFWAFVVMGANDAAYGLETYYNLSYTVVSLVFLSPLAGYGAAALLNNAIHMHFGQRGIAAMSSSFHLLAYIINSVHPPYPVLVVSFIFAGLGNGLADSAWNAWIANLANANELLGLLHGFYGLGAVLSPLIATSLITKADWPWFSFYYLMIGGAAIELVVTFAAFRSADKHDFRKRTAYSADNQKDNRLKQALFSKAAARVTWLCAAFLLGYVGTEVALGGWIVTFMMRVRDGGAFASGMTATGFWIGITVGRVVLGFVTPRIGEKLAIIAYLASAMAFELIFWLIPQFYVSAVAIAIEGFFLGPLFPAAVVAATKLLPKHLHVSSIGFAAALGGTGAAIFPFAVGAIAQAKGVQVLQPFVLGLLIAVLAAWLFLPRMPRSYLRST
ncbi:hypothetical protein UA08_05310 [Talaromyces atroroseus]|uniref:Major facilitator superfamily (MFS) profile domain-containing protein n=1 Tax=Talaromyces atroroseus TaxID=1441469 RepID=A0A225AQV1_TALAT|nr:hypothetical protein UA08_05310 [Talaromyces atroroseus]OKL59638.1 hypothetical protein UA08_05310 [Talaromyces atroroseus]